MEKINLPALALCLLLLPVSASAEIGTIDDVPAARNRLIHDDLEESHLDLLVAFDKFLSTRT